MTNIEKYKLSFKESLSIKDKDISEKLDAREIDFNFKSKYLFSEKEVFLNELLKNEGMTLINIWASWCIPCRDEHPYLMELKKNKKSHLKKDFFVFKPIAL